MLSHLLYSVLTHDCVAQHSLNIILKFANNTNIVGLVSDSDETAYREEDRALAAWCSDNNKVSKTKKVIVDYRKRHEGKQARFTPMEQRWKVFAALNSFPVTSNGPFTLTQW